MTKTNGLRKNFAHDFSKKNMVVCVCVFFLNFLVFEMVSTKKHENNFSNIGDT